jgi:membrane protein
MNPRRAGALRGPAMPGQKCALFGRHFLAIILPMAPVPAVTSRPLLPRLRFLADVLYHQMDRDRVFTHAAALTYKTLFSLLPIIVLSLLVLSTISSGKGRETIVNSVKRVLLEQLNAGRLQITDQSGRQVNLENYADQLIANAQKALGKNATGASLVAFLVLLYGAVSLMVVIEDTFNLIFGSPPARSWTRRITVYWSVLTLGPIGVALSLSLGRSAFSMATVHLSAAWLLSLANILISFLVSWLLILFMYRLVPDTRVHWRAAAIGSFLAALAWEIGKWAFGLYVATAAQHSWYGSLALLPLFMMWIYITWAVVLLGLEITYLLQCWPLLKRHHLFLRSGRRDPAGGGFRAGLTDLRWILALAVLLRRRFAAGQSLRAEEAAELLILPNDVARALLESLTHAGIVHATSHRAFVLARPPESITAFELLAAARTACRVPPDLARAVPPENTAPDSAALKDLEKVESDWARSHTLADLAP